MRTHAALLLLLAVATAGCARTDFFTLADVAPVTVDEGTVEVAPVAVRPAEDIAPDDATRLGFLAAYCAALPAADPDGVVATALARGQAVTAAQVPVGLEHEHAEVAKITRRLADEIAQKAPASRRQATAALLDAAHRQLVTQLDGVRSKVAECVDHDVALLTADVERLAKRARNRLDGPDRDRMSTADYQRQVFTSDDPRITYAPVGDGRLQVNGRAPGIAICVTFEAGVPTVTAGTCPQGDVEASGASTDG